MNSEGPKTQPLSPAWSHRRAENRILYDPGLSEGLPTENRFELLRWFIVFGFIYVLYIRLVLFWYRGQLYAEIESTQFSKTQQPTFRTSASPSTYADARAVSSRFNASPTESFDALAKPQFRPSRPSPTSSYPFITIVPLHSFFQNFLNVSPHPCLLLALPFCLITYCIYVLRRSTYPLYYLLCDGRGTRVCYDRVRGRRGTRGRRVRCLSLFATLIILAFLLPKVVISVSVPTPVHSDYNLSLIQSTSESDDIWRVRASDKFKVVVSDVEVSGGTSRRSDAEYWFKKLRCSNQFGVTQSCKLQDAAVSTIENGGSE